MWCTNRWVQLALVGLACMYFFAKVVLPLAVALTHAVQVFSAGADPSVTAVLVASSFGPQRFSAALANPQASEDELDAASDHASCEFACRSLSHRTWVLDSNTTHVRLELGVAGPVGHSSIGRIARALLDGAAALELYEPQDASEWWRSLEHYHADVAHGLSLVRAQVALTEPEVAKIVLGDLWSYALSSHGLAGLYLEKERKLFSIGTSDRFLVNLTYLARPVRQAYSKPGATLIFHRRADADNDFASFARQHTGFRSAQFERVEALKQARAARGEPEPLSVMGILHEGLIVHPVDDRFAALQVLFRSSLMLHALYDLTLCYRLAIESSVAMALELHLSRSHALRRTLARFVAPEAVAAGEFLFELVSRERSLLHRAGPYPTLASAYARYRRVLVDQCTLETGDESLARRGLAELDPGELPWLARAQRVTKRLAAHADAVVQEAYASDAAVRADVELQGFVTAVRWDLQFGSPSRRAPSLLQEVTTRAAASRLLAAILWRVFCAHEVTRELGVLASDPFSSPLLVPVLPADLTLVTNVTLADLFTRVKKADTWAALAAISVASVRLPAAQAAWLDGLGVV